MHRLAYPLTTGITIKTELPAEGRDEARAEAFQTALTTAATDPGMRLQMILGEAYSRYLDICRWAQDEIEKDEAKAPGLIDAAKAVAAGRRSVYQPTNGSIPPAVPVADTQQRIIEVAVANLNAKEQARACTQAASLLTIDHEPDDAVR